MLDYIKTLDIFKKVFLMRWLWSIFAGFYLVAYTFWIPGLFNSLLMAMVVFAITLIVGLGLVADGFSKALELDSGNARETLPAIWLWRVSGAILLFGYLLVYIPPEGRIVAHWPLDLLITLGAGIVMFAYVIIPQTPVDVNVRS